MMTSKTKEKIVLFKTLMLEGWSVGKSSHLSRLKTYEYHMAKKDPEILSLIGANIEQFRQRQRNHSTGVPIPLEERERLGIK